MELLEGRASETPRLLLRFAATISMAAVGLAALLLRFQGAGVAVALVVAIGANLALWKVSYERDPSVRRGRAVRARVRDLERAIRRLEREAAAGDDRRAAAVERSRALQSSIQRTREELGAFEAVELSRALHEHAEEYIESRLRTIPIDWASIRGIGPALRADLDAHGIRTAADIEVERLRAVPGIGINRRLALVKWQAPHAHRVAVTAPRVLPPAIENRIRAAHRDRALAFDCEAQERLAQALRDVRQGESESATRRQQAHTMRTEQDALVRTHQRLLSGGLLAYVRRVIVA